MNIQFIKKEKAISKAQYLCMRQEKCVFDIRQKLKEWRTHPDDIENIMELLIEQKFIDDARYTEFYVSDKLNMNKWGKIKIRFSLKQKCIKEDLINMEIDKINDNKYKEIIEDELKKKAKLIKAKDEFDFKNKLLRFGASRGYEPEYLYSIIEKFNN